VLDNGAQGTFDFFVVMTRDELRHRGVVENVGPLSSSCGSGPTRPAEDGNDHAPATQSVEAADQARKHV
jgi:hypothetical protein